MRPRHLAIEFVDCQLIAHMSEGCHRVGIEPKRPRARRLDARPLRQVLRATVTVTAKLLTIAARLTSAMVEALADIANREVFVPKRRARHKAVGPGEEQRLGSGGVTPDSRQRHR